MMPDFRARCLLCRPHPAALATLELLWSGGLAVAKIKEEQTSEFEAMGDLGVQIVASLCRQ